MKLWISILLSKTEAKIRMGVQIIIMRREVWKINKPAGYPSECLWCRWDDTLVPFHGMTEQYFKNPQKDCHFAKPVSEKPGCYGWNIYPIRADPDLGTKKVKSVKSVLNATGSLAPSEWQPCWANVLDRPQVMSIPSTLTWGQEEQGSCMCSSDHVPRTTAITAHLSAPR